MTRLLVVLALIVIALPAAAVDDRLAAQAPVKPDHVVVPPPADPEVIRQGGDTIADATVFSIPYYDEGTTAGYTDDYDEVCPYDNSTSPDVVYSYTPAGDIYLDIDLCGSLYDTKLYVYDDSMNLIACNDDYYSGDPCGQYVSALIGVPMNAGMQYYIVIDGYGGDCGEYVLYFGSIPGPCYTGSCPPESELEGEPELMDGYVDAYNGGCNSPEFDTPFQMLEADQPGGALSFCGKSGWYDDGFRDTDWFTVILDPDGNGILECSLCGVYPTYLFELGPHDCDQVGVLQQVQSAFTWADMTIVGAPGDVVWLWVGSSSFYPPPGYEGHEYEYILELDGLQGPVATDPHTWTQVKGLYR